MKSNPRILLGGMFAAALLTAIPAFAEPNPERNAYFGETHIHTSWSVDAWVMGNRVTGPADSYKSVCGAASISTRWASK